MTIFNITTGSQKLAKGLRGSVCESMRVCVNCDQLDRQNCLPVCIFMADAHELGPGSLGQRRGSVAYKATSKPGHIELLCCITI